MNRTLWYDSPAQEWNQALPVGNGRLGAMVFGGVPTERIQLNEDSLWYGGPRSRLNPDARANLETVRALLFAGRVEEAERLSMTALVGVPENPAHYVPLGDLVLAFEGQGAAPTLYRRELDLDTAACRVVYESGRVEYAREVIASAPDQVVALRLSCRAPGTLSFTVRFSRGRYAGEIRHPDERTLLMRAHGGGEGGVSAAALARAVVDGGSVRALGQYLIVRDAREVVLLVTAETTYRHEDPDAACAATIEAASRRPWRELKERHVADYRALFDRMDVDLGAGEDREHLSTGARLDHVKAGGSDPGLVELHARYGRYLLISASRPGTLPANLQGIWNEHFLPPWGSKYTININTEMNYWPAEKASLGECHLPLLDLLERMLEPGRRVAREMYGCRGFVAHHNTDLWGDCAPVDHWVPGSIWPMGAAWLCLHLWEHWEYALDEEFLRRAWPLMREAALFHLDYLRESPDGYLVTTPSVSPENTYILPDGNRGSMCFGPSMDSQVLDALFSACRDAAALLGVDAALATELEGARRRLPPPQVGRHGQLMEWSRDWDEAEPGHRHISHLFALHPGEQVTTHDTPGLAAACRVTLERRLAMGGGHTGWSRAWIINLWARLRDGEKAWENAEALLRQSTCRNLFNSHPPGEIFQVDGNFGATAGIMEMFLQSTRGIIHVLPALPAALDHGFVRGMRAKGGFEISFRWSGGALLEMSIRSDKGQPCRLACGRPVVVVGPGGAAVQAAARPDGVTEFPTVEGGVYGVRPAT